ncbi:MAG: energy-coupling factor transporter ATPase [Clostridia bacterium]|nr:energy-coupling factor transporter ATPase [Clostridia bacterium]MBO7250254.1 energy-coupling factor transporter ATPase [Clostridia bacterium]
MSLPFIKVENISYSYKGDTGRDIPVLRGLSVDIDEGEFVAVLGRNGSGKSTFAKLLNMIHTPIEGKIYIDGKDITDENMTEEEVFSLRKKVGMVFQNPDNQLVATVVEEDVAFGPENLGVPSAEIRRIVDEALATVGMSKYARHEPYRLSGGQKQRVAIAGIIAMTPKCIIFDESTAMLDPVGRREVMASIKKLNSELGITIIMITHYMDEAAMAKRVLVLDDGGIALDGAPSEIFEKEDILRSMGLDVPQCTSLVHRLREAGIELCGDASTPEAAADLIANALVGGAANG